jgi:hypothetical protein
VVALVEIEEEPGVRIPTDIVDCPRPLEEGAHRGPAGGDDDGLGHATLIDATK